MSRQLPSLTLPDARAIIAGIGASGGTVDQDQKVVEAALAAVKSESGRRSAPHAAGA